MGEAPERFGANLADVLLVVGHEDAMRPIHLAFQFVPMGCHPAQDFFIFHALRIRREPVCAL
jgi:hypothetical protein